jgi:hypothetical protein
LVGAETILASLEQRGFVREEGDKSKRGVDCTAAGELDEESGRRSRRKG